MDIQAAIAKNQFKRLDTLMFNRDSNRKKIIKIITNSKEWKDQFKFIKVPKNITPSWMGLPILLNKKFKNKKKKFIDYLDKKGIETRPIISGNFLNHPGPKLYKLNPKNKKFNNSQKVQDLGFLIGLHTKKINQTQLQLIHDSFS